MKAAALWIVLTHAGIACAQGWEPAGALPTGAEAKTFGVGLTWNGRVYVLGGPPWTNGGDEDGSVYSFAPGDAAWIQEIGLDGVGPLVSQGAGVDSLGRIVVFGGDDLNDPGQGGPAFVWDPIDGPGGSIADRGAQAPGLFFACATDSLGRIYSFGGGPGEGASPTDQNSSYAERFVASASAFEPIAPLPVATGDGAACPDGLGHILVLGGVSADGSARLTEVQRYDIATDTWSTTANADMPVALAGHRAILGADDRVYVIGGVAGPVGAGATQAGVHVYEPATDTWSLAPDMSVPRKWFGLALGPDDRIYAMGGDNDSGGTNAVESLYTTPCPVFLHEPQDAAIWRGQTLSLSAVVGGGGTLSYQWSRDGVDLVDGPAPGGGLVSGASSPTLVITDVDTADEGGYSLLVSNSCGSAISAAATLVVRRPPQVPERWTISSLHPAYADRSYATGVDAGVQVGYGVWDTPEYNAIDHPLMWHGSAASCQNLTPAGSQGGVVTSINADTLTGWWWQPFQCYIGGQWVTCYDRRGCLWTSTGVHRPYSWSGWEYSLINDSNGAWHVGSVSNDDDVGNITQHAMVWVEPTLGPLDLHPGSVVSRSGLTAIDADRQYGSVSTPYPAPASHAAMWSGSPASFVDLNPPGAPNSTIVDASDGQAVGMVSLFNNPHAGLWSTTPESFVDLTPEGAIGSSVVACEGGLQVGAITFPGGTIPVVWRGRAADYVDLGSAATPPFSSVSLAAIDVAPDGAISLVGSAFNAVTGRTEAVLLTPAPGCNDADLAEPFGALDFSDVLSFLSAFGAMDPSADLAAPFGAFDFSDVIAFLSAFGAGCR